MPIAPECRHLRFRTIDVLEILRQMAVERLAKGSSLDELLMTMYRIAVDEERELLRRLEQSADRT